MGWYLIGVPLIAALHCSIWLYLAGEGLAAGESPSPPPEWSKWYSPRVLAFTVLSFPGAFPGIFLLYWPLLLLLRDDTRGLIGMAVINGIIWGFAIVYLLRIVIAS